MLALLLIVSTLIVGYAIDCPPGTKQIGKDGTKGAFQAYESRKGLRNIVSCKNFCETGTQGRCKSFTFDDNWENDPGSTTLCIPYQDTQTKGRYRDKHPRADQLFCALRQKCPLGTTQIGSTGSYFYGKRSMGKYIGQSKQFCRDRCRERRGVCTAFVYDPDGASNPRRSLCGLYAVRGKPKMGKSSPPFSRANQILCGLKPYFRAESPGIFNVDGISVVDENGEAMQISVNYIVYIVVGLVTLVLVNIIICLMVNCWGKMKKGSKMKYKDVSMRSDSETEAV